MWKTEQEMIWNAKNCTTCEKIKLSHCYMFYVHSSKRVAGVWHAAVCLVKENTKWLYFTSKGWWFIRPKSGSLKLYFLLGARVLAQRGHAAAPWLLRPTRWHSRLVSTWDVIRVKPPQAWICLLGNGKYNWGRMEELLGEPCDLRYASRPCESGGVKGLGVIRALRVSFLSPDPCNTEQVDNQNKKILGHGAGAVQSWPYAVWFLKCYEKLP